LDLISNSIKMVNFFFIFAFADSLGHSCVLRGVQGE
jgi:hypothetical protein